MKRASRGFMLAMLCLGFCALAQPARPAADPDDEPLVEHDDIEDDLEDAGVDLDDVPQAAIPARSFGAAKGKGPNDLTDDQAAAVGFASLCCCGLGALGVVALIVWLVRRQKPSGPVSSQSGYVPPGSPTAPVGMQLSIFALGLEPQARASVEQQLAQLGVSPVPTTPQTRGQLVREAARALLTVQPSWRQFGYGEKPALMDLPSAESSYRAASEDFRSRANSVGATAGDQGLVVVTLLVCSRRPLLGVSRLDDPLQVRTLLEDRLKVGDVELLGAELLWAPAVPGGRVSEAEIGLRFPEMQPLGGRSN